MRHFFVLLSLFGIACGGRVDIAPGRYIGVADGSLPANANPYIRGRVLVVESDLRSVAVTDEHGASTSLLIGRVTDGGTPGACQGMFGGGGPPSRAALDGGSLSLGNATVAMPVLQTGCQSGVRLSILDGADESVQFRFETTRASAQLSNEGTVETAVLPGEMRDNYLREVGEL